MAGPLLVLLGHGPDQESQVQGQEHGAVAAVKPEARAREEDEEPDQRDANKPLEAPSGTVLPVQPSLEPWWRFFAQKTTGS